MRDYYNFLDKFGNRLLAESGRRLPDRRNLAAGSCTIVFPGITGSFLGEGVNIDRVLTAVPEPSTARLLGLGLAAMLFRRRAAAG